MELGLGSGARMAVAAKIVVTEGTVVAVVVIAAVELGHWIHDLGNGRSWVGRKHKLLLRRLIWLWLQL